MTFEELYTLIRKEEFALFIGAGFNLYAGLPTGYGLRDQLFANLSPKDQGILSAYKGESLMDFCHYNEQVLGRAALISAAEDILLSQPTSTSDHEQIARIAHFKNILTTNYDTLLEDIFPLGKVQVIRNDKDIPGINSQLTQVFKVHGDFQAQDRIVLTRDDYSKQYIRDPRSPFWNYIYSIIASKNIVFLGYGYKDLNIQSDFTSILERVGVTGRKKILISPKMDGLDQKALKTYEIDYIQGTAEEFLNGLVIQLKRHLVFDHASGSVSSDTAMQFISNFGLDVKLDTVLGNAVITDLEGQGRLADKTITISVSDPKVVQRIMDFHSGYEELSSSFAADELFDFYASTEEFVQTDLEHLESFEIKHVPTDQGSVRIQFLEQNDDISLSFKLYMGINSKILLLVDCLGFYIRFSCTKGQSDVAMVDMMFNEPIEGATAYDHGRLYQAFFNFFSGGSLVVHREGNIIKEWENKQMECPQEILTRKKLAGFAMELEKAFGVSFGKLKITELQPKDHDILNTWLALTRSGYYGRQDPAGITLPFQQNIYDQVTSGVVPDKIIILIMASSSIFDNYGQHINAGKTLYLLKGKSRVEISSDYSTITIYPENDTWFISCEQFLNRAKFIQSSINYKKTTSS